MEICYTVSTSCQHYASSGIHERSYVSDNSFAALIGHKLIEFFGFHLFTFLFTLLLVVGLFI